MDEAKKPHLLLSDLTEQIIGVFFDVYNELGPGFQEFVCRRAMVMALRDAALDVREEVPLPVWFRGVRIVTFRADIIVANGPVLVEVKAVMELEPYHTAQVLSYLKATDIEVALILNLGRKPQFKRLILENGRKKGTHAERPEEVK